MNSLAAVNLAPPASSARSLAGEQATILEVIRQSVAQADWAGQAEVFTGANGQSYPAQTLMRALIYSGMAKAGSEGQPGNVEDLSLWRLCDGQGFRMVVRNMIGEASGLEKWDGTGFRASPGCHAGLTSTQFLRERRTRTFEVPKNRRPKTSVGDHPLNRGKSKPCSTAR